MSESTPNRSGTNALLWVFIVILLAFNVIQYFLYQKKEAEVTEKVETKEVELIETYAKLDSISKVLNEKITEIRRLGGRVDSLLVIQKQLEKEKVELKQSRNLAQDRYEKIKNNIEGYKQLLQTKDAEIVKLKEVNKELLNETIALKEERNQITEQLSSLKQEKGALAEKIAVASTLRARNFKFAAISKKNKEREDNEFKVKHLEGLKITFNFERNDLAEIGTKRVIMRILDPDNSVLYNVGSGSGEFTHQGSSLFYTAYKDVLFDNSEQPVTFLYNKGSEYKSGQYKVEFYCEGVMIGSSDFVVK